MKRCHVTGGNGDISIVRVRKELMLLGERGDIFIVRVRKHVVLLGEERTRLSSRNVKMLLLGKGGHDYNEITERYHVTVGREDTSIVKERKDVVTGERVDMSIVRVPKDATLRGEGRTLL
jgi:hypothetical protein